MSIPGRLRGARCRRLLAGVAVALGVPVLAAGQVLDPSEQMQSDGTANPAPPPDSTPMRQARDLFFDGQRHVKSASKLVARAGEASGEERVELARKAKGELEVAVERFTSAIQSGPSYLDAYVALGEALRALGRAEEALQVHSAALARDKASEENFQGYVVTLLALHRLGHATALYDRLESEQPARARFVLESLRQFYAARRHDPAGLAQADLDRLGSWLAERSAA